MHYDVRYDTANESRDLVDLRALQDMREWLGEDRWRAIGEAYVQPGAPWPKAYSERKAIVRNIRMGFAIAGVQFRPVTAYIRALWAIHSEGEG